jgi:hypothetical protein
VQDGWLDIDGGVRSAGGAVDIGADQYDGTTYSFPERIIRVSASGNDANDGSSWTMAMGSISGAIIRAMGEGAEIWVAGGTPVPLGTYPVIRVPTFVYLYGGFIGYETNRSQRDWAKNSTVLGTTATVMQVQMLGFGEFSAFSGFTVQNGFYSAISCPVSFSGEISNNRIINNNGPFDSATAIFVAGNAQIINNVIASNRIGRTSVRITAGIYCDVGSAPLINLSERREKTPRAEPIGLRSFVWDSGGHHYQFPFTRRNCWPVGDGDSETVWTVPSPSKVLTELHEGSSSEDLPSTV